MEINPPSLPTDSTDQHLLHCGCPHHLQPAAVRVPQQPGRLLPSGAAVRVGILGVADGGEINSNENENGGANDGGDSSSRKLISQSGFERKIITKDRSLMVVC